MHIYIYVGLNRGVFLGLSREILGAWTVAHMAWEKVMAHFKGDRGAEGCCRVCSPP